MHPYARTKSETVFHAVNAVLLVVVSLAFLIPFLMVLSTSFVSEAESARRGAFILVPQTFDLSAYKLIFSKSSALLGAYQVTLFRVAVGTTLNLVVTAMLAYGLAKRTLPGRNGIVTFIFVTMIFSGGLVPSFMLIDAMGLRNSVWVLVLPGLVSAWNMFIMRTFFLNIPPELEESAVVDGANAFTILWRIILPVSLPSFATIGLFYAVGHWNAWFDAAIYIDDQAKMPVQMVMRNILLSGLMAQSDMPHDQLVEALPPPQTLKSAVIIVCTLPIVVVYPFIQKYFVKGAMIGSVKG
ncbi:carbohydrate ABC transporter permease [Paenibacillus hodogayensis]|uniref:Carbohydrate ABC transporter permease n=1 Tax=Paenibacillus hodogayensis TaxID=279208 RepID=A0ABV5VVT1_9BACL